MLSPRSPSVPRLRIACLGPAYPFHQSRPSLTRDSATVGLIPARNVTTNSTVSACKPRPTIINSAMFRPSRIHIRGKKTRTVLTLDELPQGPLVSLEPLPAEEEDHVPSYPTVVLQARCNMQKFDKCVLLTRVGGFYELYFEQADEYGPLLNLKVAQKRTSAGPVSMAGFPFFQLDRFLKVLVQDLNRHVAIAEEFAHDPSEKIKSDGLMYDRRVARIITPGTLIDENFMDPYANNYIMAIHLPEVDDVVPENAAMQEGQALLDGSATGDTASTEIGVAWLDLSTGYFFTQPTTVSSLGSVLSRVSPREIVLDKAFESRQDHSILTVLLEDGYLISYSEPSELQSISDWRPMLEGEIPSHTIEHFTENEVSAASLLLHYVSDRLRGLSTKLQPPVRHESMMNIDKNSMRSLEIKLTIRDSTFTGSLLHAIRRTVTKSGARLLSEWLSCPSTSLQVINFRQELVSRFIQNPDLRDNIILLLRRSHDSQRLLQKFALNRGEPDDLLRLASTIKATDDIVNLLTSSPSSSTANDAADKDCLSAMVHRIVLEQPMELARRIWEAIDEEGLVQQHQLEDSKAGEMIALAQEIVKSEGSDADGSSILPKGATAKSNKQRKGGPSLRDYYGEDNEAWIMKPSASDRLTQVHSELASLTQDKHDLTDTLRARLGAASLTLKWTPGLGHICHIKGKDAKRTPTTSTDESLTTPIIRTLTSSRSTRSFHQPEWTALGEALDKTRYQIRAEEQHIFTSLREAVVLNLVKLRRNASVLDELDIATSFARLAVEQQLVRPIVNETQQTIIIGGRHPTVEGGLAEQGRTFQRNDCLLSPQSGRIWLITGPNMAGKSTFLRQNALITVLAQIGCYVPADYAELGIVDAIFSRVGSADNLYRDQSTFMVEMLETAAILRQATPRSFVIMDEIGRGTTPEDGAAVAFASLHHLVRTNKCRSLFATHFHAVADLVVEQNMAVTEATDRAATEEKAAVEMYCTDVEEDDRGGFIYVHKLRKGVNRQSHALKVAKLAGLPEPAMQVARDVLRQFRT
ncbi:muts domain V-domain-containing protein [Apodospora peruviana]|uniref:Muts domain V-domain-containing protein n=1 Tax=Apodospora peruviana TaxID=516989 RepID=A0AAE0IR67_9PEZI|nr:muts domain V-domain-containing protein [Apodospora peruviana]